MGKSMGCLNIIACGKNDSVDRDDLEAPGNKGSSDRRGWSFRKKSSRHRVLNNNANSEIPSSANKENAESHVVDFHTQPDLAVHVKTSSVQPKEEKSGLPKEEKSDSHDQPESKPSDANKQDNDCKMESTTIDESSVITIQAAIRGFLARRRLLKQNNNVIKLQAAVRGHLVRTHAIGTLRCVQAIIKMQALVRARRPRPDNTGKDDLVSTSLNKKETRKSNDGQYTYVSIDKLLNNTFARQLMETTPRTQSIKIKCEPLKSDSAWKWLERWVSVSSVANEEPRQPEPVTDQQPQKENLEGVAIPSGKVDDDDDDLISHEASNLDNNACKPMLLNLDEQHNIVESNTSRNGRESVPIESEERDLTSNVEEESLTKEREQEIEPLQEPDLKSSSFSELAETESTESRKASHPSFIAAQSKFEELTTSSGNGSGAKPSSYKAYDSSDQPSLSNDNEIPDNDISNNSTVQIVGSECGTELSISSTLDSPDNCSESVVSNLDLDKKISGETHHRITKDHPEIEASGNIDHSEVDDNDQELDPSPNKSEIFENMNPSSNESVDPMQDDVEKPPQDDDEKSPQDDRNELKLEAGSEISHVACKSSSPESSPRSHSMTMPESHEATPSSQVSVNMHKKSGGYKSKSSAKAKSKSFSSSVDNKKILLTNRKSNQDSASKDSSERNKTGKRQPKSDYNHKDQELSDSSGSNSLPSYMQATESARAKAISNGSPRSSPDVHDKDFYLRKRQSLPGAHERQGSPRIQRSLSQAAQQNAKGNGTQSPQDRKWRR